MNILPYIDVTTVIHREVCGCCIKVTHTTTYYIAWFGFRIPYKTVTHVL